MIRRSHFFNSIPGFVFLLTILIFGGCNGPKNLVDPLPDWIQQRPQVPGHYIGIASASKIQFPQDAAERAQQSALAELSAQIRVSIDSKSILNSSQFQGFAGQTFSETITSSSVEDLEGYERVGYFESQTDVWTFYRLNQITYERIRGERKAAALELAGDFWIAGQEAIAKSDIQQGLNRFIRSLESIEKYWGEINFWMTPEGETIALDRACLDGISNVIGGLSVSGPSTEIILEFQQRYSGPASCSVDFNGTPVGGVPIAWTFDRGTLPKKVNLITGENGVSEILLDGFEAGLNRSELRATIELNELMPSLSTSKVSKLIGPLQNPQQNWTIKLPPPTLLIDSREHIEGRPTNQKKLRDAVAQGLNRAGLNWTQDVQNADLKLSLESDTRRAGSGNGFYTALLDARVLLETIEGKPILQQNLESIKGVQLNWNAAHEEAYRNAQREMQETFIQDLIDSLYK